MPIPIIETHYDSGVSWNSPTITSPLDTDLSKEKDKIVFLVTGYAKYRCPYVWVKNKRLIYIREKEAELFFYS